MTNQIPPSSSGPALNPTGIWVSGFLLGLLVGLVPWAISQFIPRGDKPETEQQSLNVINPVSSQQVGANVPAGETPPVTATPVATPVPSGTVTQAPSTIPNRPSTSPPANTGTSTNTNVNVSRRPIPARW
ncbi:MAG TPA: hypothetical protein IGS17_09445 [Oscillatoriales cyanobacterium M59_W2019_021]|nr:MAG: hypothetical protein D6728_11050 [Cyanobacteria bacterium J055]HIK31062.1 hypothetical protein [Oscillatoriales cyanobacterium M4454_W2019_049]HIK51132.1 hypothetical protein [Oscillatoriales cyanobacterium M59_W2019_021]